ncbi:hypothetical protein ACFLUU_08870 [Chloroflexota bacterium]
MLQPLSLPESKCPTSITISFISWVKGRRCPKIGVTHASGDISVTFDADVTTDPEEMLKFIEHLYKEYDFAEGSRFVLGPLNKKPLYRILGN